VVEEYQVSAKAGVVARGEFSAMAVKMRLMRMGKTKQPVYRVVVMDSRRPRDSRYIEQIGRYDPRSEPSVVEIDKDRAQDWIRKGAQPTDSVRKLLVIAGAMSRLDVASGRVHTVEKGKPAAKPAAAPAAPPPPTTTGDSVEADEPSGSAEEALGGAAAADETEV
jgi:small subunit ribosomal protein S16